MSDKRGPYDGKPYYCAFCGMGLGEYYACEDVRCQLESKEAAEARKYRHDHGAGAFMPPPISAPQTK